MKYWFILFLALFGMSLSRCSTDKKIVYNIPADYPESKKPELLASLEKGKKLYKANCSDCHGIFTKGKDGIPNFSNEQIDNYSASFMRRNRRNHAVAINMAPEQLNEILTFLRYRKTNGTVTKPKRDRKVLPSMPGRDNQQ